MVMSTFFESNLEFYGKHAEYLQALAPDRKVEVSLRKQTIFNSMIDAVIAASLIGFVCNRKSKEDKSTNSKKTIFYDTMRSKHDILIRNYRIIMLLDDKNNSDVETRINRAFRYDNNDEKRKPGLEIFYSYILGGLEILYENLLENSTKEIDDYMNCCDFIDDYETFSDDVFDPAVIHEKCSRVE